MPTQIKNNQKSRTRRSTALRMIELSRALADRTRRLRFGLPVTHVYRPLDYARELHESYLATYADGDRDVLFLGMNPGPWGMAQTGIPFGAVGAVREWLRIDGSVEMPPRMHEKRPIQGLDCTRNEAAVAVGRGRLIGFAARFFNRFFVANYCPLCFLEASGCNRTPDKLPPEERRPLYAACDQALVGIVGILKPSIVIGVGAFAETRAREALKETGVRIGRIPHPSPASPAANRGWAGQADSALASLGIAFD
ncbi:MAG: single-stranded DNA-binding protein [Planctomycetes bacterium]|nr:single-stranded DNA-binding protein [Planctomycetota bacterium]